MMMAIDFLIFASALAASVMVFWLTLVPALPRIVAILRDGVDPALAERHVLVVSELRVRARMRALPVSVPRGWRAAA